jgi:hypothetical protein
LQDQTCFDLVGAPGSKLKHAQHLLAVITAGFLATHPARFASEAIGFKLPDTAAVQSGAAMQGNGDALVLGLDPCNLRIEPLSLMLPS